MTSPFKEKINYYFLGIIIVLGILLYLPSVHISFINDEIAFITRNQVSSPAELVNLFDKKDYDGDYYRPVVNFISGLLTSVFGYDTAFYRIFNLLLHTANGILVYIFAMLLISGKERREIISLFAAIFFIAFPLNDYAVIWHTDLFDRIMTFFYLLSLIFFLKKGSWGFPSLFFFLLSILSKEMAFSLPIAILLLSFLINKKGKSVKTLKDTLPYILILIILILFRLIAFDNNIFNLQDAHSEGGFTDIVKNLILFGGMLIVPFFLREIQEIILSHQFIIILLALIVTLLSAYFIIKNRKNDLLFFILILLIIALILPASRLLMRWYLYLPSAGFCILISYLIFTSRSGIRNLLLSAVILFGIYYSFTLYRETLWIKVSGMGEEAVQSIKEFSPQIKNNDLIFLTVPAKVKDIPLFQLGFDHHLRYMMGIENNVYVLSKSYLESGFEKIDIHLAPTDITISQNGDNYFMLSDIGKNIKFSNNDFKNNKLIRLHFTNKKEPGKIIFTFSSGKFHIIKE